MQNARFATLTGGIFLCGASLDLIYIYRGNGRLQEHEMQTLHFSLFSLLCTFERGLAKPHTVL